MSELTHSFSPGTELPPGASLPPAITIPVKFLEDPEGLAIQNIGFKSATHVRRCAMRLGCRYPFVVHSPHGPARVHPSGRLVAA